ncbi:MAG TPA: NAD-dependent epimerase/dehydratase family protein [Polyangia bacterium]
MSSVDKVVVTGGAGFIGSHLVDALLAEGHEVHVVDNLATGRRENLAHHAREPRLSLHERDINGSAPLGDSAALSSIFAGATRVFHLAARADIVPSVERPLDYARANVDGTFAILEAARAAGVERFVYTASSSCYGANPPYPTPETAAVVPEYPYALTKALGEQAALHWHRVYGLPVVSLRLFNVYGPRARSSGSYGAMYGVFLAQKLAGKPYTVVGDGTQSRDFTFVSDVVEAFVRAGSAPAKGVVGEIFNVGTGNPVTVNRIVELLGGDRVGVPKRPGEPERTQADARKIADKLGWRARTPIERGVGILLDRINDWKAAPVWTPESISEATRSWFACLDGPREGGTVS